MTSSSASRRGCREIGRQVKLPGFRPGKVPLAVLRQRYGSSVMGEVLERAVNDGSNEAMREHKLRPALQPKVEIVSFNEGKDLEYKLAVEVLPNVAPMNFAELKLERLRPEVPDAEVDSALERIARQQRKDAPVERPATTGDIAVIDFTGSIDGEEFAGGSAKGHRLELGAGQFHPGFEDQLIGARPGEQRTVAVTFPADYGASELAGKNAFLRGRRSRRCARSRRSRSTSRWAEAVGMENLPRRCATPCAQQIKRDYDGIARPDASSASSSTGWPSATPSRCRRA